MCENTIMINFHSEYDFELDRTIFKCKHCPIRYTHRNVTKMRKHLKEKCPGRSKATSSPFKACELESPLQDVNSLDDPEMVLHLDLKSNMTNVINHPNPDAIRSTPSTNDSRSSSSPGSSYSGTPLKRQKQESMDKFIDCISKEEQNILQEKLAKAIFTSKSPFTLVENSEWLEFFSRMKPTFKPPSTKALATNLLDKCYNEMKEKVHTYVHESTGFLSIQLDGWTDTFNRSVFNFIINAPRPVFVESLDTGTSHHTAEYIANETRKVMQKYSSSPERFAGIITDNAAPMIAAARLLLKDYPALILLTCFAHSLNLLVGDILKIKSIKNLLDNVASITKTVRNCAIIRAQFAKICEDKKVGVSLVLPCATRWSSNSRSMENMIRLKVCLQLLAVGSEE